MEKMEINLVRKLYCKLYTLKSRGFIKSIIYMSYSGYGYGYRR